jgi:hypothetical protein
MARAGGCFGQEPSRFGARRVSGAEMGLKLKPIGSEGWIVATIVILVALLVLWAVLTVGGGPA